ncbi:MAG TPA: HlyD family efflux transporter periplasmic adaptor subunit [Candidatus Paceibacterota bacterium]|nr:HlyD family efflux transporter periplasmic adaptor subunit [Candidatus Paceibacterota bacterium]
MANAFSFIRGHRRISAAVLVVIVVTWVVWPGGNGQVSYVLAQVERSTLVVSVSGSGQVEASQQIDLKPKSSGDVIGVYVTAGQTVSTGQLIAQLDASDELQALADAQAALEKLQRNQPTSVANAKEDLDNAFEDAFADIADAYLDLPNLLDTAYDVLYDDTLDGACSPNKCELTNLVAYDNREIVEDLVDIATRDFTAADEAFNPAFAAYRALRYDAKAQELFSLLDDTEDVAALLTQALKSELNVIDAVVSDMKEHDLRVPSVLSQYQSTVGSAIGKSNSIATRLTSVRRSIIKAQDTLNDLSVDQPLDFAAQQRIVEQKREAVANRSIRAPFTGTLAMLDIERGNAVTSGTTVGTLVTDTLVASIPLNEVDAANVTVGQQATITFDALSDLIVTGSVIEVDVLGTVSQGVVTYTMTIGLNTTDIRIKPGMTVAVSIITAAQTDALVVPSSAIKVRNDQSYVQVYNAAAPAEAFAAQGFVPSATFDEVAVTTGLSNDTSIEVLSGLQVGDAIVVRTVNGVSTATTTSTRSFLNDTGTRGGNVQMGQPGF